MFSKSAYLMMTMKKVEDFGNGYSYECLKCRAVSKVSIIKYLFSHSSMCDGHGGGGGP